MKPLPRAMIETQKRSIRVLLAEHNSAFIEWTLGSNRVIRAAIAELERDGEIRRHPSDFTVIIGYRYERVTLLERIAAAAR